MNSITKRAVYILSDHPRVVAFAFSAMCLLASAMPVAAGGSGTLGP